MHAEIHDAAAARERRLVEPGLVRPVSVVEHEICRVDVPQLAGAYHLADSSHPFGKAVRQVDTEQPVRGARSVYDGSHLLCRSAERFLTEYGRAAFQCTDRLLRVHGAWCRDYDPVDPAIQDRIESGN